MPRLLIIGYVWPEPGSSAAGSRMMQLINFFLSEGYDICFTTTAVASPFSANLEDLGIQVEAIELNKDSFNSFVENFQPQVVLFDRFMMEEQFGWRVSEACPGALKILDTEDLHFLRRARQAALKQDISVTPALLQSDSAKREIASIYRCDLSLIISEVEMELLKESFQIPDHLLFYLPLIEKLDDPLDSEDLPAFGDRANFVSIGNFRHDPNWDAVLHLYQDIWPLIKEELPYAEVRIYGAYPSQKVFQLNNPKKGFHIMGRAASAEKVLRESRVLLAPLRFGAGIKGKFIDAMKTGTPSVTTEIGAEGMAGNLAWGGYIENNKEDFARAAIQLYREEEEWKTAQENGFRLLQERFTAAIFLKDFKSRLEMLLRELPAHRERNFIGALLQHHQVNSTRHLSRYIEMKTKYEACTASKKETPT